VCCRLICLMLLCRNINTSFKNYDSSDGFRRSVWKFHVINCDEVLKKFIFLFTSPRASFRLGPALHEGNPLWRSLE
jgi:hypothetical protein